MCMLIKVFSSAHHLECTCVFFHPQNITFITENLNYPRMLIIQLPLFLTQNLWQTYSNSVLSKFQECSGLEINKSETEGMWLGPSCENTEKSWGISWPANSILALGILNISYDDQIARICEVLKILQQEDNYKIEVFVWLRSNDLCSSTPSVALCKSVGSPSCSVKKVPLGDVQFPLGNTKVFRDTNNFLQETQNVFRDKTFPSGNNVFRDMTSLLWETQYVFRDTTYFLWEAQDVFRDTTTLVDSAKWVKCCHAYLTETVPSYEYMIRNYM